MYVKLKMEIRMVFKTILITVAIYPMLTSWIPTVMGEVTHVMMMMMMMVTLTIRTPALRLRILVSEVHIVLI